MKSFQSSRTLPMPALSKPARLLMATLAVAAALTAGMTQNAVAQPAGAHGGMHGMHGGMGGMGHEAMMVGPRMLDLVGATSDQRAQIKTIVDAARGDLKANRDSARSLQQQMQAAFTATTVDARTVESLRVQLLALHDSNSKRMTQAMLEASRVLSVDQRKLLADAMTKRQAMMQRHAAERAGADKPAK